MKRLLLLVSVVALVATSCGPSVSVVTDKDSSADFSKYKTFQFAPEVLERPYRGNQMTYQHTLSSIEAQMDVRNIVRAADADLFINIYIRTQEKTQVTQSTNYYGGYYSYGYGPGWGGAYGTTYTDVNQYTDGYMFIDFIDHETNMIVFQGILHATVEQDPRYMQELIDEGLRRMFRDFPVAPVPTAAEN